MPGAHEVTRPRCPFLSRLIKQHTHPFGPAPAVSPQSIKNPPSNMAPSDRSALERFTELYDRAEVYYAYEVVHKSVHSPFRTTHPDTLFNASRFLLMRLLPPREVPLGVSVVNVVYVLAKQVRTDRCRQDAGAHGGAWGGASRGWARASACVLPELSID